MRIVAMLMAMITNEHRSHATDIAAEIDAVEEGHSLLRDDGELAVEVDGVDKFGVAAVRYVDDGASSGLLVIGIL